MLHILWLIIKCIGILLALLLAVLLFAVLLVLFCPVRYRAEAVRSAEDWEASGRVIWLFGLFSVSMVRDSAGFHTQIRLCRVKTDTWKKLFTRKKRRIRKIKVSKKVSKDAFVKTAGENQPPASEKSISEKNISEKNSSEKDASKKDASKAGPYQKSENIPSDKENFLKRIWRKIADQCRSIRDVFRRIFAAIQKMCSTISLWKDFLEHPQTMPAFHMTWQQILALLRHAGPQKWKGYVELGLGDPASTGQFLAVLGALYPLCRGRLSVNPVWDRKVLEGNAHVKGRIYGAAILLAAARLYFDKDVKRTFRWLMRQAG